MLKENSNYISEPASVIIPGITPESVLQKIEYTLQDIQPLEGYLVTQKQLLIPTERSILLFGEKHKAQLPVTGFINYLAERIEKEKDIDWTKDLGSQAGILRFHKELFALLETSDPFEKMSHENIEDIISWNQGTFIKDGQKLGFRYPSRIVTKRIAVTCAMLLGALGFK